MDIVVTVTAQQVSAMKTAYERAAIDVNLGLAGAHVANAMFSGKLGPMGAGGVEALLQGGEAGKPELIAARAAYYYERDGQDGVYDGVSALDRAMRAPDMSFGYVVHQ